MATLKTLRRGKRTRRAEVAEGVPAFYSASHWSGGGEVVVSLGTATDDPKRDYLLSMTNAEADALADALTNRHRPEK